VHATDVKYDDSELRKIESNMHDLAVATKEAKPLMDKLLKNVQGNSYKISEESVAASGMTKAELKKLFDLHKKCDGYISEIQAARRNYAQDVQAGFEHAKQQLKQAMSDLKQQQQAALARDPDPQPSGLFSISGERAITAVLKQMH
jgi:hypothetical protein